MATLFSPGTDNGRRAPWRETARSVLDSRREGCCSRLSSGVSPRGALLERWPTVARSRQRPRLCDRRLAGARYNRAGWSVCTARQGCLSGATAGPDDLTGLPGVGPPPRQPRELCLGADCCRSTRTSSVSRSGQARTFDDRARHALVRPRGERSPPPYPPLRLCPARDTSLTGRATSPLRTSKFGSGSFPASSGQNAFARLPKASKPRRRARRLWPSNATGSPLRDGGPPR